MLVATLIRLTAEQKIALDRASQRTGRSISSLIREAVEVFLKKLVEK